MTLENLVVKEVVHNVEDASIVNLKATFDCRVADGMDYKAVVRDIKENPRKYDAVWKQSQTEHMLTGYGDLLNIYYPAVDLPCRNRVPDTVSSDS